MLFVHKNKVVEKIHVVGLDSLAVKNLNEMHYHIFPITQVTSDKNVDNFGSTLEPLNSGFFRQG